MVLSFISDHWWNHRKKRVEPSTGYAIRDQMGGTKKKMNRKAPDVNYIPAFIMTEQLSLR